MDNFSERINELRKEKGLTQKDLSLKLGLGRTTVHDWERKRAEPSFDTLLLIADYFKVTTDYLLGRED